MSLIDITSTKLELKNIVQQVSHSSCGGIDVFIGTVRDSTKGRSVDHLLFEAYESMAVSEMKKIADQIHEKWPVHKVAIHHRTGKLVIGEEAVIIAVSSPHRKEAFEACRFAIDTLKQTVPIWKKEVFDDGEVWVSAHP